jgi:hypothetical protein
MRLDANTLEIAKHNRVEQAFMPAAKLLKKSALAAEVRDPA